MLSAVFMEEQHERQRIAWTTRINLRQSSREAIRAVAKEDRISIATVIGIAIETYVTARSTA